jgi:hypothetical protein
MPVVWQELFHQQWGAVRLKTGAFWGRSAGVTQAMRKEIPDVGSDVGISGHSILT